jgi:copper chaperone
VKLLTVLIISFMLWSANVFAGEVHIQLGVDGMSCPFCVFGIEKQLKKINGVEDIKSDLAEGKFWVKATGTDVLSEDNARTLLEDAGFTLRSFEVHEPAGNAHQETANGAGESGQDE